MNITLLRSSLVVGTALVVSSAACGKKDDKPNPGFTPAGSGSGSAAGKPVEGDSKSKAPPELAAWMPKNAAIAWQESAWNSRLTIRSSGVMSMAGDPAAIEIKGDKAKVFDGKTEHTLDFAVAAPCRVEFKKKEGDGTVYTFSKGYLLGENGKLLVADGYAGYRKGKTAFVCSAGDYYVLDDKGECKKLDRKFGDEWTTEKATCTWKQVDGKDALDVDGTTLVADGDLLQSEQFSDAVKKGTYHAAAKSWDEAKAAVTALVKENDPVEIAKAAGGKVGETNTVASLQATFGSDRKSVEGKEVEVTALYLNSNSSTSGGQTTYNAILVDKQGDMKLTLTCNLDKEVKDLKQYDKVKAKGVVGEGFDRAELDKCTLAKAK